MKQVNKKEIRTKRKENNKQGKKGEIRRERKISVTNKKEGK
jgi:hypothetical protein